MIRTMRGLFLALLLGACRTPDSPTTPIEAPTAVLRARVRLDVGRVTGLSGMATDDSGRLWAVPERRRVLLALRQVDSRTFERVAQQPIAGIADGVDTEALAWLGENRFALGTETQRPRRSQDDILIAETGPSSVTITGRITFSYRPWGLRAEVNRGIEGLCHSGGKLLVAVETVARVGNERWGPVGLFELANERWSHYRLRLRTPTGKLSSLACRERGSALEVLAVERHYGVSRLLRFVVGRDGEAQDIVPTEVADLGALIEGVPNMEGVGWMPDGGVAILVDNDTGGVTGPTEIILIDLSAR